MQIKGTNTMTRAYYAFAGMTVAVRTIIDSNSTLDYFLTDHLGSVVAVTDANGNLLTEQRYLPFGQVRSDVGPVTQADFGYTFQRNNSYIKLMDYRSRWYDSGLARFTQPDKIVPQIYRPQSLNRFSYVNNNPIRYKDPNGHCAKANYGTSNTLIDDECETGYLMPRGLSTAGVVAWYGLINLGVFEHPQDAMEIVVGNEYGGVGSTLNNIPALDEAMTRRYHQYCSDGPWSNNCMNSFWGYMQPIRDASDQDMANAIKAQAYSFDGVGAVTEKARGIITGSSNPDWAITNACGNGTQLCEWATIWQSNSPVFYSYLWGASSDGSEHIYWQTGPGGDLHVFWLYSDQAFVVTTFNEMVALWVDFAEDWAKNPPNYSMFNFK